MRARVSAVFCALLACAPDDIRVEPRATVPELVAARDLNPDPNIVEITLVAAAGIAEYEEGLLTSVLGFRDGGDPDSVVTVPGPLIEATVGDRLIVHFRNELPSQQTTVHWHGLRLPADMDGNPMVSGRVDPGESFEYDFVLRDAGYFWYHPHVDTDAQLELGLQGPLLVHERSPLGFDRERLWMLDDVALAEDGAIDIDLSTDDVLMGRRDGRVIVNGAAPGVIVARPHALERWRVVNSSNGRFFVLEPGAIEFTVIGWDGGLVPEPYTPTRLVLAPGERYDLAVRIPESGSHTVRSLPFARGEHAPDPGVDLFSIEVFGERSDTPMPPTSTVVDPLPTSGVTRTIRLRGDIDNVAGPVFFINDQRWPINTPLEAQSGDVEIWEVINEEEHQHPFHIHGLFFQVLDRDGTPEPYTGWKDTTVIAPNQTVRLAVPYDEPGMWMFHCQIPEHAERGMMGDLLVSP